MAVAAAQDIGTLFPTIAVTVSVDAGPALEGAIFEVVDVTRSRRSRRIRRSRGVTTEGDVVDIEIEPVGAVEVADGHITGLAFVSAQVNGILIPVALGTGAARTFIRLALGAHRPFLDGRERGSGSGAGGDGHAKVFSGVAGILSASPEADGTTEGHLRRHEVVVRIQSAHIVDIAAGEDEVGKIASSIESLVILSLMIK